MVQPLKLHSMAQGPQKQVLSGEGVGGSFIVGSQTMCIKILLHFAFDSHDKKKVFYFLFSFSLNNTFGLTLNPSFSYFLLNYNPNQMIIIMS